MLFRCCRLFVSMGHTERVTAPRPRRLPPELAVVAVVGAVVAAADLGWLDGLSLDSSLVVTLTTVAAAALFVVVVVRAGRRWWTTTLPLLIAGTVFVEVVIAWYLSASNTITDAYPVSFFVWIGAALLVAAVVVITWRTSGRAVRTAGLVAVPMTVAAAFLLINAHYGYWPTMRDLLGHPVATQIDAATFGRELESDPVSTARVAAGAPRSGPGGHRTIAEPLGPPSPSHPSPLSSLVARTGLVVTRGRVGSALVAARRAGQFALVNIPATRSHFVHRGGGVYLPPAYFTSVRRQLGVLVMLGGTPSSPNIWATAGHALATAHAYAAGHAGVAPVMLFVDPNGSWSGDTECVNGPHGQAETYLTVDVVHYASTVLHLSSDPRRWGIVGFSEGGTCAIDLALRHPSLFGHFVDLGGDAAPNLRHATLQSLYGGSSSAMTQHTPSWLMAHHRYQELSAWFASGRGDASHLRIGVGQEREARRAGIGAQWFVGPGGHDWHFCTWALHRVLPTLAAQVDRSPPSAPARAAAVKSV